MKNTSGIVLYARQPTLTRCMMIFQSVRDAVVIIKEWERVVYRKRQKNDREEVKKMITKIGLVAGEIWEYLDNHGKTAKLKDIISSIGKDREIVLMSVGWLAREGHISVEGEYSNCYISLTKTEGTNG